MKIKFYSKKITRNLFIFTKNITLLFMVIGLALACVTIPTQSVELSAKYQEFLNHPVRNERIIDTVWVRGNTSFICRDTQHSITPSQRLGTSYQVSVGEAPSGFMGMLSYTGPQRSSDRHDQEPILDQLLNEAKRQYPSEVVNIRNARTGRHNPTNPRQEEYTEMVRQGSGNIPVTRVRTVWNCFPVYFADVITTEPMPRPVTHSEEFRKQGATRNDIYRLARNWLDDNTQRRRIRIDSENFDRGRIIGTVTSAARTDQTYFITSTFTIDVYDARVEIRFADTILQRTDASLRRAGIPEPIFLQSIADATQAELVDFSTSLRSYILAR